jgi:hypothetical protein
MYGGIHVALLAAASSSCRFSSRMTMVTLTAARPMVIHPVGL